MFIRTNRLLLRPLWPEDCDALFDAIAEWDIVRNLGTAPWPYTRADADARINTERTPGAAEFAILRRTSAEPDFLGTIGFGRWNDRIDIPEIGYWLRRSAWGQGYATEAGQAVLEIVFDGLRLPELAAGHYVDNPTSGTVLKKLGFVPTGEVLPYACRARGADVDSVEYRLRAKDWREGRLVAREAA